MIPRLHLLGNLDVEIHSKALVVFSRYNVVETNKSRAEEFGLGVLKPGQEHLQDWRVVIFENSPILEISMFVPPLSVEVLRRKVGYYAF